MDTTPTLGLTEVARNTGSQLGGAPMEGDIGVQEDKLLIYVNLFANQELARQAEGDLHQRFVEADFDENGWEPITVPGHWRSTPAFASSDGPVLYRHRFPATPLADKRRHTPFSVGG